MDQLRAEAWLHKTPDLNLIPGGSASHEFDADGCPHICVFGQWHMLLKKTMNGTNQTVPATSLDLSVL